jgi:putative endonuclease
MRSYYVYIMTNKSGTLYAGVTNDLWRRVREHKMSAVPGFTSAYKANRLLYFEEYGDVRDAIAREKQLKGWRRVRKRDLVKGENPRWLDLAEDWFDEEDLEGGAVREGPDPSLRSG